jgi:hypothetical protein
VPSFALRQIADIEHLWVGGLALLQLYLVNRWLPLKGESYEWAQYLLLGTLFPALLLALSLLKRFAGADRVLVKPLERCLAFACLVTCAYFSWQHRDHAILIISLAQCALLAAVALVQFRFGKENAIGMGPEHWIVDMVFAMLAWTVSVRLFWWASFEQYLRSNIYGVSVFAGALLLVTINLSRSAPASEHRPARSFWPANLLAFAIFVLAGLRIDYACPFPGATYHHWSAIVGPAELVRQGGWLLWDIPSQYGFLSTLTVAWLPTHSVWQSFYVVNATLLTITACFLFLQLRALRTGACNWLFSLTVTLAAVFFVPGRPQQLYGYNTPAVGPFRFFWCFALLMVLAWQWRRSSEPSWKRIAFGNLTWLVGTLWSAESAIYSATIWLPAYVFLTWRGISKAYPAVNQHKKRFVLAALAWNIPLLLLVLIWTTITSYYLVRLGHGPDWLSYVEYCLAFSAFALPIDPHGCVWVLCLAFCALAAVVVHLFQKPGGQSCLHLALAAWSALWAAASYFVGRSHEINLTNLSPVIVVAMAIACGVLSRERNAGRLGGVLRLSFIPILTMLLTIAFGNEERSPVVLSTMRRGYIRDIDRLLPQVDESAAWLLRTASVTEGDPILLMHHVNNQCNCVAARWVTDQPCHQARRVTVNQAWLPLTPYSLSLPLSKERARIYMSRFMSRTRMSGWLLYTRVDPARAWFFDELQHSHAAVKTFEHGEWKLTWFACKECPGQDSAKELARREH